MADLPTTAPVTFEEHFAAIRSNIEKVIKGKPEVIDRALVCLFAGGHLLVEDVPGVGKTSLAKAIARSIDCDFGRMQFTPDVLPTDVVGVSIWNRETRVFEFQPGPVFSNIVLGDEINRASPKTQAALLEAMEERQVTVDGVTRPLGSPFMVVATQNPIEHEGTYPLPESQLDRFLMRISIGYPAGAAAIEILDQHGVEPVEIEPVVDAATVVSMAKAARSVHVAPALKSYIIDLAERSRGHHALALGVSPRATVSLQSASRALAASRGRDHVLPDDIKELAISVLAHRLLLAPDAQLRGTSIESVLSEVLTAVPIPAAGG
ncbi:MAG: MoxR family ATPase [Actinomycetia bacterium]|nr:MoxR family ATPase [Actinomycetes bacterium]MCP4960374.1 MoxR family ATPase [Actinomycetes bacterium]